VDSFLSDHYLPFLNNDELEYLFYINLARINPRLFAQTYLSSYECPPNFPDKRLFNQCKRSLVDYLSSLSPRTGFFRASYSNWDNHQKTLDSFNKVKEFAPFQMGDSLFAIQD